MKKIYLLLFGFVLTSALNAQSKAEIFAKENTENLSEILEFTEAEYTKVYDILVEKETEFNVLRKKYKDDKDKLKAEIQKLNPIYNRRLKDFLGQESMIKYHDIIILYHSIIEELALIFQGVVRLAATNIYVYIYIYLCIERER